MTKSIDRGAMAKLCPFLRRERPFDCACDRAMLGLVSRRSREYSRCARDARVFGGQLAGGGL